MDNLYRLDRKLFLILGSLKEVVEWAVRDAPQDEFLYMSNHEILDVFVEKHSMELF